MSNELRYSYEGESEINKMKSDLDNMFSSIDNNIYISKSVRNALIETFNVMRNYFSNVEKISKALSEAYSVNNTKNILSNEIELYANLDAINAMLRLMREYVKIDSNTENIEKLTNRTITTIALLIQIHIQHNAEKPDKLDNEIKSELTKYNALINEIDEFIDEDLDELKRQFEGDEDLTRGTYNVLSKALSLMEEYYYDNAFVFALNATDTDKASVALNELIEAYASFSAFKALYSVFCSYNICVKHLEHTLEKALQGTKHVIDKIIDYYIKS
ncbi:MAG: hypothetical protein QXV58_14605 [Saccharolobus sp.]|uniref:hypothetical protein n=1 Tax=Saccharolobus sp. TaxID=2100761 RepID=UPI00316100E6